MPSVLNKHQQKTEVTQRRLLKAAYRIFARDGFEAARIDDIATEAGYTRGAFYAHFASKEDLFFALVEDQSLQALEVIRAAMAECTTERERMETLRDYYIGKLSDRRWSVLILEFKLYALRHPGRRAKLAAAYRSVRAKMQWGEVVGLCAEDLGPTPEEREMKRIALQVMLQGLVLELAYDPATISEKQACGLLGRLFDFLVLEDGATGRLHSGNLAGG